MKTLILAATVLAASLTASSISAQQNHGGHGQPAPKAQHMPGHPMPGHSMPGHMMSGKNASPSTKAYEAANDRMHKDMAINFTGDADIDFFKGMIPHHQGAIDMAKVVLQHGKDPETKKMAEEIIAAQEKEIAFMREWLKKKGQ